MIPQRHLQQLFAREKYRQSIAAKFTDVSIVYCSVIMI